jgi:hypothetical protein
VAKGKVQKGEGPVSPSIPLREMAGRALREKAEEVERAREKDEQYHRYLARARLGELVGFAVGEDSVANRGRCVEVDGLRFLHPARVSSDRDLRLVYVCEECDGTVLSVPVKDLAHLGKMLLAPEFDLVGGQANCADGRPHKPKHPLTAKEVGGRKPGRVLLVD